MEAIEQAARDAVHVNPDNPMLPLPSIVRPGDSHALSQLGVAVVGNQKKPLIDWYAIDIPSIYHRIMSPFLSPWKVNKFLLAYPIDAEAARHLPSMTSLPLQTPHFELSLATCRALSCVTIAWALEFWAWYFWKPFLFLEEGEFGIFGLGLLAILIPYLCMLMMWHSPDVDKKWDLPSLSEDGQGIAPILGQLSHWISITTGYRVWILHTKISNLILSNIVSSCWSAHSQRQPSSPMTRTLILITYS